MSKPQRLPFKERVSEERRRYESLRVRETHPNHRPVIVSPGSVLHTLIDRDKYLVPADLTMAQFIYVLRRRLKLEPAQALFLTCNWTLLHGTMTVTELYDRHVDPDGFLYVTYSFENAFGCK